MNCLVFKDLNVEAASLGQEALGPGLLCCLP